MLMKTKKPRHLLFNRYMRFPNYTTVLSSPVYIYALDKAESDFQYIGENMPVCMLLNK